MAEDRGSKRRRKQDPHRHGARPRLEETMEGVSDELILVMAKKIGDNPKLPELALKFGLKIEDANSFIMTNRMKGVVSSEGTRMMLCTWRDDTPVKEQCAKLEAALIDAGLAGIADEFSSMVEEKARKVPSFPMNNRSKTIRGSPYRDGGAEEPHLYAFASDPDVYVVATIATTTTITFLNEVLQRRYTDPARLEIVLQNQGFLPKLKRRDSSSAPFYVMENSRHDIFKSPTRRLTVSGSGSNTAGLTSLCRSLSYDWATHNGASALSAKQHLFELSANDIKPNQTIENAIKDQLFPDRVEVDEVLIRQLLKDMPDGITIFLDGFNGQNCGDNIMDVLLGRTLQKVTVMVTTQPRFADMLHRRAPGWYDRIDMY